MGTTNVVWQIQYNMYQYGIGITVKNSDISLHHQSIKLSLTQLAHTVAVFILETVDETSNTSQFKAELFLTIFNSL